MRSQPTPLPRLGRATVDTAAAGPPPAHGDARCGVRRARGAHAADARARAAARGRGGSRGRLREPRVRLQPRGHAALRARAPRRVRAAARRRRGARPLAPRPRRSGRGCSSSCPRSARSSAALALDASRPRRAAAAATRSSTPSTTSGGEVRRARPVREGDRVDRDARLRRLGRSRGADDADRRRDRLDRRPLPRASPIASGASCSSRAPPPACRPCSARRSAPRSSPSRCSIATTSSPRRSCPAVLASVVVVLGLHLVLRRVDALRARAALPVRARASAALRACWRSSSRCAAALFVRTLRRRAAVLASASACPRGRKPALGGLAARRARDADHLLPRSAHRATGRGSASSAAATARRRSRSRARRGSPAGGAASRCSSRSAS